MIKSTKCQLHHFVVSDLEAKLEASMDCRTRLIATDGVFSMDGNVAPLDKICDLAEKLVVIMRFLLSLFLKRPAGL